MQLQNKLQIFMGEDGWKYVSSVDDYGEVSTLRHDKDFVFARPASTLEWFQNKYPDREFRVI